MISKTVLWKFMHYRWSLCEFHYFPRFSTNVRRLSSTCHRFLWFPIDFHELAKIFVRFSLFECNLDVLFINSLIFSEIFYGFLWIFWGAPAAPENLEWGLGGAGGPWFIGITKISRHLHCFGRGVDDPGGPDHSKCMGFHAFLLFGQRGGGFGRPLIHGKC